MQSDAARSFAAVDPKIDMTYVDFFERKAKRMISREKFVASRGPRRTTSPRDRFAL